MAVKCFAAMLSKYNFVYFSLNFISATTFVPHLINSRASWNIKPVVIWLHYYDNRPSYENWLYVCFCFETSAGCIANYTVVLFNYWINIRRESQVELLFTNTTTYQAFSLPIKSDSVWLICLLLPWISIDLPLSLNLSWTSNHTVLLWLFPKVRKWYRQIDSKREKERGGTEITDTGWVIYPVMSRQNIL